MIDIKKLLNEYVLSEKTFPIELYHYTHSITDIILTNAIKCSFASFPDDNWNAVMNRGKHFYLSLSYDKFGRYAHLGNPRPTAKAGGSVIVFNTHALQSVGKLIDVDYWGNSREKYSDSEKEVRLISDKQILAPLSKFVDSIHIMVSDYHYKNAKFFKMLDAVKEIGLPVFFYEDSRYFRMLLSDKAVDADTIKDKLKQYTPDEPYEPRDAHRSSRSIQAIIDIFDVKNKTYDDMSKDSKRILDYARYYSRDFKGVVSSDMANANNSHVPELHTLATLFRKNNIKSIADLQQYVINAYNTLEKNSL